MNVSKEQQSAVITNLRNSLSRKSGMVWQQFVNYLVIPSVVEVSRSYINTPIQLIDPFDSAPLHSG